MIDLGPEKNHIQSLTSHGPEKDPARMIDLSLEKDHVRIFDHDLEKDHVESLTLIRKRTTTDLGPKKDHFRMVDIGPEKDHVPMIDLGSREGPCLND